MKPWQKYYNHRDPKLSQRLYDYIIFRTNMEHDYLSKYTGWFKGAVK